MTPPKVEFEPKPASSIRISNMMGAPLGGTTRAGQAGVDCKAFSSIRPWNGCAGGGRYRPSIVVVAVGEPGSPVVCCAIAGTKVSTARAVTESSATTVFMVNPPLRETEQITAVAQRSCRYLI